MKRRELFLSLTKLLENEISLYKEYSHKSICSRLFIMTRNYHHLVLIVLLTTLTISCGKKNTLKGVFQKKTPYEAYTSALRDARLDETALGKQWIEAGMSIFDDSLTIRLPYSETAYFDATEITANGYKFTAERGQKISIKVDILSMEDLTIFLDLFTINESVKHVATADTTQISIKYEVEETGVFFLRLQPELLKGGRYQLEITSVPVLAFPVVGKTSKSIASFFGVDREGGIRKHEGVDIFAPRGTPVVAATEGSIGRVNLNRLGGKVVWMRDSERHLSYYYAHLDSQMVKAGQHVKIGDTLGLVGNTGNAITTPPHLHFGIYSSGYGAIDPYTFLHTKNSTVNKSEDGGDYIGRKVRIKNELANFRLSPTLQSEIVAKFPQSTLLEIKGNADKWLRAESTNGIKGFVHFSMVEFIDEALQQINIEDETALLDYPGENATLIAALQSGTSIQILAELKDYFYVKSEDQNLGWMRKPQ